MTRALVGIVMGSDSDLPIMKEAAAILDEFKVANEVKIVSAHRTPDKMVSYANSAKSNGIKVIIAGAGGAAHLPGMIASITPLPVIGVPIKTSSLEGIDSLLSIMQMPPGVPVATMAINGAKNAGILACQILGIKYSKFSSLIEKYKSDLRQAVILKDSQLQEQGYTKYFGNKKGK
jgi:5-(carboxyamino)imidazole ribonucleotide mutase